MNPSSRKPLASLSLDVDNQWSYMKIHGDDGWDSFPSYLDVLAPRVLDVLARHGLRITFFVVGQDAALPENRDALGALAAAGHEIGNHSFRHEPWLHRYSEAELDEELQRAEDAIESATGVHTDGFRGPGYSLSETTLRVLLRRGYAYDASTLPTVIGPLARTYYFRTAQLTAEQRDERELLYGTWADGRRPVRPYRWAVDDRTLLELPVTTLPGLKVPIHVSYLLMLSAYSPAAARAVLRRRAARLPCHRRRAVDPHAPARPHLRRRREGARASSRACRSAWTRSSPGSTRTSTSSGVTSTWCRWGSTPGRSPRAISRCARRLRGGVVTGSEAWTAPNAADEAPHGVAAEQSSVPGAVPESRPLVSVIVPAYNEAAVVVDTLTAALGVPERRSRTGTGGRSSSSNDGSTDDTGALADEFAATHPNVRVLHHRVNFLLGQALRYAFNSTKGGLRRGDRLRPQLRRRAPRPDALRDPGLEGAHRDRVALREGR